MNRRAFLRAGLAGTGAAFFTSSCAVAVVPPEPASANPVAEPFDREINAFMEARGIPGAALAVVKGRRIVYAQGYGWADRARRIPATADSLFRIASVSKPITAAAVFKLVEEGRLDLDASAFGLLPFAPEANAGANGASDARLARITVRQLLHHTGGWDRDQSFDPMFRPAVIARAVGVTPPAGPDAVIRYMLGQRLDFDPGARYAYSNFGYCVLGRVIEKASGLPYEEFVRTRILAPCGIHNMRIGASLDGRQAPGEVRYYMPRGEEAESVFPGVAGNVPWPYGGFHLEAMDAHGGWIASAVDLARFALALDDRDRGPLLKPESIAAMHAPPPRPVSRSRDGALDEAYYGCGWMIRPIGGSGRANSWHSGSLPGTTSLLVRRWDGLGWAVLFNQRSRDRKRPDSDIDRALHRAAAAVKSWGV